MSNKGNFTLARIHREDQREIQEQMPGCSSPKALRALLKGWKKLTRQQRQNCIAEAVSTARPNRRIPLSEQAS